MVSPPAAAVCGIESVEVRDDDIADSEERTTTTTTKTWWTLQDNLERSTNTVMETPSHVTSLLLLDVHHRRAADLFVVVVGHGDRDAIK